jgi:hypothetical protein
MKDYECTIYDEALNLSEETMKNQDCFIKVEGKIRQGMSSMNKMILISGGNE